MSTTRFILIRHGETVWNIEGREMGQLDSPLTSKGIRQAELLADRLEKMDFRILYSSDLQRAYDTAKIIASRKNIEINIDVRLRERNMGIFQGLTVSEMKSRFPVEWKQYQEGGFEYVIPNGESARQRVERTVSCLNELVEEHSGETVLCVTHTGILMGFFQYVLGLPHESGRKFKRLNAAINVFESENGRWVLETWGDVSHISDKGDA
jgi:probable phosphoglycerate mutase